MSEVQQLFRNDPLQGIGILLLVLLAASVGLALSVAFLYLGYFLLTLPMRRNERARLLLDLLELGLKEGRTPGSPGPTHQDITRLKADTDYEPEYLVEKGMADYIAWLQAGNGE